MNQKMKTLILSAFLVASAPLTLRAQEFVDVAGCAEANLVLGAESNQIAISGKGYTPKCLTVKVGSSVTIEASGKHPLQATPDTGAAVNPFSDGDSFTTSQTRTMNEEGVFGYYCTKHGDSDGSGMAGVIVVVP